MSVGRLRKGITRFSNNSGPYIAWEQFKDAADIENVALPRALKEFKKQGVSVLATEGRLPELVESVLGDLESGHRYRSRALTERELDKFVAFVDAGRLKDSSRRVEEEEMAGYMAKELGGTIAGMGNDGVIDAENCPVCAVMARNGRQGEVYRAMGENSDMENVECFTTSKVTSERWGIPLHDPDGESEMADMLDEQFGLKDSLTCFSIEIDGQVHPHIIMPPPPSQQTPVMPENTVSYPVGNGRFVSGPPLDEIDPEHCDVCKAIKEGGDIEAAMKSEAAKEGSRTFGNKDLL